MPLNWPYSLRPRALKDNKLLGNVAPQFSVFVCGRDPSKITTPSSLRWQVGPVPDPRVNTVSVPMSGFPVPFYRYTDLGSGHPAAIPPGHLHGALNLSGGKSGILFVHDATSPEVEDSIRCLHRHVELLLRYGGRGVVVIVNSPSRADVASDWEEVVARFEAELHGYSEVFEWRVRAMPVEDAYRVVAETLLAFPLVSPNLWAAKRSPDKHEVGDFWDAFHTGSIFPWRHRGYLRAAYITLVDPANRDDGLLEVATKFAADVNSFKQRNFNSKPQPESRTLTVFWLYHVKLAITVMHADQWQYPQLEEFERVFHYVPELVDDTLPSLYYSRDCLTSEYAENFWMLPDLRSLFEPPPQEVLPRFREQFTKKNSEDPDRLLRFAFAVVQRYLRPGETRLRSWFINLAFSSLERHTLRQRTTHPIVPRYSVTQSYFYLQLAHAALSQLLATGEPESIQAMSFPLFKETFHISPSAWRTYYSPELWDSLKARAAFVPPDLRPLPDTVPPISDTIDTATPSSVSNEPLRKQGLLPELPPLEVLHFHQAVLLEEAKTIPPTLTANDVTTHAHLLKYIHAHIVLPSVQTTPFRDPLPLAQRHLSLLSSSSSPLPRTHLRFYLALTLHSLRLSRHQATHKHKDEPPAPPPGPVIWGPFSPATSPPNNNPYSMPNLPRLPDSGGDHLTEWMARMAEFEGWCTGEWGLVLCWDEAWKVEGAEARFGADKMLVEEAWGRGGVVGDDQEVGGKKKVEEEEGKKVEEVGAVVDAGKVGDTGVDSDGEDGETLVADGGDDDDEWEVVSQDTLC